MLTVRRWFLLLLDRIVMVHIVVLLRLYIGMATVLIEARWWYRIVHVIMRLMVAHARFL